MGLPTLTTASAPIRTVEHRINIQYGKYFLRSQRSSSKPFGSYAPHLVTDEKHPTWRFLPVEARVTVVGDFPTKVVLTGPRIFSTGRRAIESQGTATFHRYPVVEPPPIGRKSVRPQPQRGFTDMPFDLTDALVAYIERVSNASLASLIGQERNA
ncbi:hypothetical protein SEA_SCENTAE_137 [Gordonia phage SCentae]|nr:hypothetical protein SEA_SCENTAE_137 [Gordonia phage SCentae]